MTEICFDGIASDDWGAKPRPAAKSSPYAKAIGFGLAAALSTTAVFTLMHRDAFRHSSWGGVVAGAVDQIRAARTARPGAEAPAVASSPAHRMARLAGHDTPSWLPQGLDAVAVARSGRLARHGASTVASAHGASGLGDVGIGRSTRLAMAEPQPSEALIRGLEAARPPLPAARTAVAPPSNGFGVETARLEPGNLPAPLPSAVPDTRPAMNASAPASPKKAPAAPEPQQALDVPLPKVRPVEMAKLETPPADKAPEPGAARPVADAAPANGGLDLPQSAPLPGVRPQRSVRSAAAASGPTRGPQPSSPRYELAYASPETTRTESDNSGGFLSHIFGSGRPHLPGVGSGVAVYSIKDATVYMPNGQKLEAHSGMGRMTDNPRYADEKMRGPTPPNVYNLTMRKHLFHGVEAVRMLPADGRNKFGRDGFLAHTYMLRGRPGESNGCVVFRHYAKFLQAFKAGKVDKMIVVPDLSHLPTQVASR